MAVLTVNAGSSSIKVAVFQPDALDTPLASKEVAGLGDSETSVHDALRGIQSWLGDELSLSSHDISAIGHRVVHGGTKHIAPEVLTNELVDALWELVPLAPNHMPRTLEAIAAFRDAYPDAQHVACFDTAFFSQVPASASTLPLPASLQTNTALRRYGFHGLAYESLLANFHIHEGTAAAHGRVIMAHLGSGASVTACVNGAPIDMTMGFTPVSGIVMSTRSGDLEPGVLSYLQRSAGMSLDAIDQLVAHDSGLKGVSGITGSMRELLDREADTPQAALAISLFVSSLVKAIGGYIALLGGVDSIIFSGGIGEQSSDIRRRVMSHFSYAGALIDDERNDRHDRLISSDNSPVGVHVIPSQEQQVIARHTAHILSTTKEQA